MAEPKFTQGPWIFNDSTGEITAATGTLVTDIDTSGIEFDDERDSTARLIAAAPDLYEALNVADIILRNQGGGDGRNKDQQEAARAALAKARGEVA